MILRHLYLVLRSDVLRFFTLALNNVFYTTHYMYVQIPLTFVVSAVPDYGTGAVR